MGQQGPEDRQAGTGYLQATSYSSSASSLEGLRGGEEKGRAELDWVAPAMGVAACRGDDHPARGSAVDVPDEPPGTAQQHSPLWGDTRDHSDRMTVASLEASN
eukprot:633563-Rhodomonas_salina.1